MSQKTLANEWRPMTKLRTIPSQWREGMRGAVVWLFHLFPSLRAAIAFALARPQAVSKIIGRGEKAPGTTPPPLVMHGLRGVLMVCWCALAGALALIQKVGFCVPNAWCGV